MRGQALIDHLAAERAARLARSAEIEAATATMSAAGRSIVAAGRRRDPHGWLDGMLLKAHAEMRLRDLHQPGSPMWRMWADHLTVTLRRVAEFRTTRSFHA